MVFVYFYLFLIDFRERGREGERQGEKHQCETEIPSGCLVHAPWLGTKPRHVPWLGIQHRTFWFAGQGPTNWATLARAQMVVFGFQIARVDLLCHLFLGIEVPAVLAGSPPMRCLISPNEKFPKWESSVRPPKITPLVWRQLLVRGKCGGCCPWTREMHKCKTAGL